MKINLFMINQSKFSLILAFYETNFKGITEEYALLKDMKKLL